ncbi:MAG: hypothetical protein GF331_21530 [Chitinivibrionales bacterium]|nr:hypothetical protein [Chitinivibrionales bacterium]
MSDIRAHDMRNRYCPRLGHEIAFSYCRAPGEDIPCKRLYDCWWQQFDIRSFVAEHYDDETRAKMAEPSPDRASSLFEMLRQAQERVARNKGEQTNP